MQLFDERAEVLFAPQRLRQLVVSQGTPRDLANIVNYYREFDQRAPLLARFCLEHLLDSNAALRSSSCSIRLMPQPGTVSVMTAATRDPGSMVQFLWFKQRYGHGRDHPGIQPLLASVKGTGVFYGSYQTKPLPQPIFDLDHQQLDPRRQPGRICPLRQGP